MGEALKKVLWILFAVAMVIVFVVWMIMNPRPDHIEDTNGPDDYSLEKITESDVVSLQMGSRGTLSTSETYFNIGGVKISDGIKHSASRFTGVYLLYSATIFKGSDVHIMLSEFKIHSGNFAFYVVLDGEIVGEVKPSEDGLYTELIIPNIEKTCSIEYVIAGESADFEFVAPFEW